MMRIKLDEVIDLLDGVLGRQKYNKFARYPGHVGVQWYQRLMCVG